MLYIRNIAKTVVFGIAYGRGAKAIARAARAEGVYISELEAEKVIMTIFNLYPGLRSFFEACRSRVEEPRWLCGAFGRYRRFPMTKEWGVLGSMERQAMNFPIQGMIADAVSRAVDHLYHYRTKVGEPDLYRIALQIHDAVVLEVPVENLDRVYDEVLPTCMSEKVPVYPCQIDGTRVPGGPYRLGLDQEVFTRWGQKITKAECRELGINPKYGKE
jgi:DNA polymerase I-like protein with 3'-5' exonuclease and polymerase domains